MADHDEEIHWRDMPGWMITKTKKRSEVRGKFYKHCLINLTIGNLSDSLLKWNKLLREAADACLCSPPSRKPSAVQEEISDILESELCPRDRGAGPFNWGSLSVRFNDMSSSFRKHLIARDLQGSQNVPCPVAEQLEEEQLDLNNTI